MTNEDDVQRAADALHDRHCPTAVCQCSRHDDDDDHWDAYAAIAALDLPARDYQVWNDGYAAGVEDSRPHIYGGPDPKVTFNPYGKAPS